MNKNYNYTLYYLKIKFKKIIQLKKSGCIKIIAIINYYFSNTNK